MHSTCSVQPDSSSTPPGSSQTDPLTTIEALVRVTWVEMCQSPWMVVVVRVEMCKLLWMAVVRREVARVVSVVVSVPRVMVA